MVVTKVVKIVPLGVNSRGLDLHFGFVAQLLKQDSLRPFLVASGCRAITE